MKRLFDDPALPPELRADLQRSQRAGHDYDALAKLPELRSALSDPARQVDVSNDTIRFASAKSQLASWTWKLALLVAIGGGVLIAAWPADEVAKVDAPALPTPQPIAIAPVPAQPAAAPPTRIDVPEQAAPAPRTVARSSRREIAQLERVRALLEQDPAAAYRLARRSEREFPDGLLSEERRALWILALVKSGARDAAEREARQFFARYPESPQRARVESALPQ